jgi:hypothetical protein
MDDWYKKHFGIIDTVSQAMDQFKRFEDLYGSSFHRATKDILAHEELIKSTITPFYSSYADIITYLQPEIERVRELHLSTSIIDAVNQANLGMTALFLEQTSLSKLAEEADSINRYWKTELESVKHLASGVEAAKLALGSHLDKIAQVSLLAQERLLKSPWSDLERSVLYKTNELSSALQSFNVLTENYNSLVHSFSARKFNIVNFPPFVSGLPPIEILTSSDLLDTISRTDTEEYVEEADALESEIREDIEGSLEELLCHVNPEIRRLWLGAKEALYSTNPDKKRHIVVSLREMLTHILYSIAPDNEVSKWTSKPSHYHEGRPTREARLLFVCRDINHGPFEQFVNKDVESHIKFIRLFQRGTHEININFTDQQIRTLIVRTEALARFLLITWKNTI